MKRPRCRYWIPSPNSVRLVTLAPPRVQMQGWPASFPWECRRSEHATSGFGPMAELNAGFARCLLLGLKRTRFARREALRTLARLLKTPRSRRLS
jgi:hypothetical protein